MSQRSLLKKCVLFRHSVILMVFVASLGLVACSRQPAPKIETDVQENLTDVFVNLDGERVSINSFSGQTVMLDFWATWCPPCRAELPELNEVIPTLKKSGVIVLSISVDRKRDTVHEFVKSHGYKNLNILHDQYDVAKRYDISAIPTKVLLDRSGHVVRKKVGALKKDELLEFVGL